MKCKCGNAITPTLNGRFAYEECRKCWKEAQRKYNEEMAHAVQREYDTHRMAQMPDLSDFRIRGVVCTK